MNSTSRSCPPVPTLLGSLAVQPSSDPFSIPSPFTRGELGGLWLSQPEPRDRPLTRDPPADPYSPALGANVRSQIPIVRLTEEQVTSASSTSKRSIHWLSLPFQRMATGLGHSPHGSALRRSIPWRRSVRHGRSLLLCRAVAFLRQRDIGAGSTCTTPCSRDDPPS